MKDLFQSALGIEQPWFVESIDFDSDQSRMDIHLNFYRGSTFANPADPSDQPKQYKAYDTVKKSWKHLNFFQHECHLHAPVPRVKLDDGQTKLVVPPWSGKLSGFTLLFEALLIQLCRAMPVHNVSQMTGVSDYRIWRLLERYVEMAKQADDFSKVSVVGMDETSVAKGHDYITLFVDMKERKTLHISDGKSNETVKDFGRVLEAKKGKKEHIKQVSCDMSPAFIKGVREQLPSADITFDKFHIIKIINEGVDKVRREETKTNPLLTGSRYSLLKNEANLTRKQRKTRAALSLPGLNLKSIRAMNMRETFQQLYTTSSKAEFEERLQHWYYWLTHSRLEPMIKVAKTIKDHWDGVVNWKVSQINNGLLEGLNSIIQAAKRKARGYKKYHFKIMAYLLTGKLDFSKINNACLPTWVVFRIPCHFR